MQSPIPNAFFVPCLGPASFPSPSSMLNPSRHSGRARFQPVPISPAICKLRKPHDALRWMAGAALNTTAAMPCLCAAPPNATVAATGAADRGIARLRRFPSRSQIELHGQAPALHAQARWNQQLVMDSAAVCSTDVALPCRFCFSILSQVSLAANFRTSWFAATLTAAPHTPCDRTPTCAQQTPISPSGILNMVGQAMAMGAKYRGAPCLVIGHNLVLHAVGVTA